MQLALAILVVAFGLFFAWKGVKGLSFAEAYSQLGLGGKPT